MSVHPADLAGDEEYLPSDVGPDSDMIPEGCVD